MNEEDKLRKELKKLNSQIQVLVQEKADLHRSQYNNEITKTKFNNQLIKIEQEIAPLVKSKIEFITSLQDIKDNQLQEKENKIKSEMQAIKEFNKKAKQQKAKITEKPKVKENKPTTYKSLIVKALKHPKVLNEEQLIYVVLKKKPGKDKETLRRQVRNIISIIKKSKEYSFDQTKYRVQKNDNEKQ